MPQLAQYKKRILDEFEARTDHWNFHDFESAIGIAAREPNNYHLGKQIIKQAKDAGDWPKTLRRYILTYYAAFKAAVPGCESLCRSYLDSMTDEEKESFGITTESAE